MCAFFFFSQDIAKFCSVVEVNERGEITAKYIHRKKARKLNEFLFERPSRRFYAMFLKKYTLTYGDYTMKEP